MASRVGRKTTKQELTEEQKQEIKEAFDLFDTDGSGLRPAGGSSLSTNVAQAQLMQRS